MKAVRPGMPAQVENPTAAPADRGTMGEARSGWLSRGVVMLTFVGMAGSVVAMAISYIRG